MHPNDGRVISNFIMQALKNEPISIFGDGRQTRSFCYVDDLGEGMMRFMNTGHEITGPVNLGNPSEFSIMELAQKVITLTGSASEIVFRPLPQDDPRQRKPDIGLAKKLINWTPHTTLDEGLVKTVEYFKTVAGQWKG
jgi:UDP-glucuronate decarboxylase